MLGLGNNINKKNLHKDKDDSTTQYMNYNNQLTNQASSSIYDDDKVILYLLLKNYFRYKYF